MGERQYQKEPENQNKKGGEMITERIADLKERQQDRSIEVPSAELYGLIQYLEDRIEYRDGTMNMMLLDIHRTLATIKALRLEATNYPENSIEVPFRQTTELYGLIQEIEDCIEYRDGTLNMMLLDIHRTLATIKALISAHRRSDREMTIDQIEAEKDKGGEMEKIYKLELEYEDYAVVGYTISEINPCQHAEVCVDGKTYFDTEESAVKFAQSLYPRYANYEVDSCSWEDGIALYATGNLEDLPHLGGEVRQMVNGMAVPIEPPYQEKLGSFPNLAEAREFCERMGLPMPGTSCVLGW